MNKFDNFIKVIIAIIGETFEMGVTIIKYMLGLIWITYRTIRGKNFTNMFHKLNRDFINEIKVSLNIIIN